jgi:hypothetical protein
MKVSAVSTSASPASIAEAFQGVSNQSSPINAGWNDIVSRVARYAKQGSVAPNSPTGQIDQLSGLIKLQMDVSRYQLRVELVSKVSESAVASMRKLQQNQ